MTPIDIPPAVISPAIEGQTAADEMQWLALEAESAEGFSYRGLAGCGVKFTDKPHPGSAGADLPMRGITHGIQGVVPASGFSSPESLARVKKRAVALFPELSAKKRAPIERLSSPHPQGYRPDLPLRGLGFEGSDPQHKWTLTAAEKREMAGRPLTYSRGGMTDA